MADEQTASAVDPAPKPPTDKAGEVPVPQVELARISVQQSNETVIIDTPRFVVATLNPDGKMNIRVSCNPSEMQEIANRLDELVQQIAQRKGLIVPARMGPRFPRGN